MIKVIDFWAAWCGPCKALAPTIDKLTARYSDNENVVIEKVNVDENPDLAREFNVRGIPTLVFLKDGVPVQNLSGVRSETEIAGIIDEMIIQ